MTAALFTNTAGQLMATELVARNGIYLASYLRELTIPHFRTFIDVVVPDVLSAFRDLEASARTAVSRKRSDWPKLGGFHRYVTAW